MHSPSQTPTVLDRSTGDTPVVHLTRRERIAAERAAERGRTAVAVAAMPTQSDDVARYDDLLAAPVTPAAPASPVLPASSAAPLTPPAPTSPVVAEVPGPPVGSESTPASPVLAEPNVTEAPGAEAPVVEGPAAASTPAVSFDELVGTEGAPTTQTIPVVLPEALLADTDAQPLRRRDVRSGRGTGSARSPRSQRTTARTAAVRPTRPARPVRPAAGSARGTAFRRTASSATAVGAVLFTAGLVVSTSLPAQALWTTQDAQTVNVTAQAQHAQTLSVGDAAAVGGTNRDAYTVSDVTQYKNTDSSTFTNDPDGTIQWPFLTGVPITSGFGGRNVAGCSFCSTNHMGVDFAPGEGTPIRVIAAGTVIKVQADDGGYGNDVWVEHDVDGKQFVSVYGHMEDGSFQVTQGQQVAVGDVLGRVGSTGNSTGPHLHLEVHVNDVPVDPLAWLKANAN